MRRSVVLATVLGVPLAAATACHEGPSAPSGPPPQLQIGAPFTGDTPQVLAGRVHFTATCTDPGGPCRSVEVRLNGIVLASGTTGVDTVVSLAGQPTGSASFVVSATGAHRMMDSIRSPQFFVRPDTGWTFVAAVAGTVKDASDRWAVYERDNETSAKNLQTGTVTGLNLGTEHPAGWVGTSGAAIEFAPGLFHKGVRVVGVAGSSGSDGFGMQVRGDWAGWMDIFPWGPRRFNTATGAAVSHPLANPYRGWISDDGTLTYTDLWHGAPQLFAILADGSGTQLTSDTTVQVYWGMKDGALTVFARGATSPTELVLRAPDGDHVLGTPASFGNGTYGDLRDGWVLWATGAPGSYQLWTRSPAGQVRRADAGLNLSRWSLGWDGKLLLFTLDHAYVTVPPYTTAVDLGGTSPPLLGWHERRLYGFFGNAIFRGSW